MVTGSPGSVFVDVPGIATDANSSLACSNHVSAPATLLFVDTEQPGAAQIRQSKSTNARNSPYGLTVAVIYMCFNGSDLDPVSRFRRFFSADIPTLIIDVTPDFYVLGFNLGRDNHLAGLLAAKKASGKVKRANQL